MKGSGKTTAAAYGSKAKKTRDEDLQLFREMFKRESERDANLLLDVSEDFEPQTLGNHLMYKLPTLKKDDGKDFLAAEKDSKNDYDWLKTPPATPLFPSLEMEASDPNMMIFHRELPILHSFQPSRFINKMEEPKFKQRPVEESKFRQRPKSPSSISSTSSSSSRPETPSTRPPSSSGDPTSLGGLFNLPERPKKQSASNASNRKPGRPTTPKSTGTPATSTRSTTPDTTTARTQRRGGSPGARPRMPAILMHGFSDEAPPNLITSAAAAQRRPKSATRGGIRDAAEQKAESANPRRQSCSPSVSRGRNVDAGVQISVANNGTVDGAPGVNGEVVAGSLMVQKMMNARRSTVVKEKDFHTKNRNSTTTDIRPDLGKLMSRTSLNMALKQMEISKNPTAVKNSKNTGIASQTTIAATRTGTGIASSNKPRSDATVGSAGRFRRTVKKAESKD